MRCLACEARLELPPRSTYAACRHCGSEYRVSRRGGAYALEPLDAAAVALSREVAAVEREQEMGCANTALSLVAGLVLVLCVVGGVGRFVFQNDLVCLFTWVIALVLTVPGAVIMLRNLERDRRRKARLLAAAGRAGSAPVDAARSAGPED